MVKVGLLGGSFNPPHLGHLRLAEEALRQLGLAYVLLLPANQPPHKEALEGDPGGDHRLAMCRELLSSSPLGGRLEVSGLELERGGRSYTVDTLEALRERKPDTEPVLLLGSDSALAVPCWRAPQRILELAAVAVAPRDGAQPKEVAAALRAVLPSARVIFLAMEPITISSTLVRSALSQGQNVERLVGRRVAHYIKRHRLYSTPAPVG